MRTISFSGDAQAQALATIATATGALAGKLKVVPPGEAGVACIQEGAPTAPGQTVIAFPRLDLYLLWPLYGANPYDAGGRFPHGNVEVIAGVRAGRGADDIFESVCSSSSWTGARPNLHALLRAETARLLEKDARLPVRIGAHVLKHFRRTRLFVAPHSPANALLCDLLDRILDAAFPGERLAALADLKAAADSFGARDLLGVTGAPIHPAVAGHFKLDWYLHAQTVNFHDEAYLTHDDYVRLMIDDSVQQARAKVGTPA